jgi:ubiquinone/menaquinone biosynthesis C-methylase UbiE
VDEPTQSSKDRAAVAGHFTRVADAYRQYWSAALLPASRQLIDMLTMVNARAVVDVGAGVGSLYSTLSSAAPQARVVLRPGRRDAAAFDISRRPRGCRRGSPAVS